jgi:hypothetical protein
VRTVSIVDNDCGFFFLQSSSAVQWVCSQPNFDGMRLLIYTLYHCTSVYSFIGLAHQSTPSPARGLVFVPAVISLALDLILTTAIAVRFLVFRRRAYAIGAKYGTPYASLVLIFVESGALSTLAKVTAVVSFEFAGAFIVPFCVSASTSFSGDDRPH